MKVTRNTDKETVLLDAMKASFDEPREGTHLSDLMGVRESHYKRALPMPLTQTQVGYFASGRAIEDVVARFVGIPGGAVEAKRVKVPGLIAGNQRYAMPDGTVIPANTGDREGELIPRPQGAISYRPDFRWGTAPVEFKSRRAEIAKPGTELEKYDHYLMQLKGYCAFDRVTLGGLYVFDIGGSCPDCYYTREPSFAYYDVEFNVDELEQFRGELEQRRQMFEEAQAAIATKGVKAGWNLPLCAPWKCGKNKKTVTTPARCEAAGCEVKHRTKKAGHEMTPEVATWEYIPRCAWHPFCRPELVDIQRGGKS